MNLPEAILLGIVQGLTEFLPISSSGHLVLFQRLFGLREAELFFDIAVHVGTLVAVLAVFWRDVAAIAKALLQLCLLIPDREAIREKWRTDPHVRLGLFVAVGSIPTAVLGLLFHRIAEELFASVSIVGWMLMVTGLLLWSTRRRNRDAAGSGSRSPTVVLALIIGIVQGLAIIPGISRSGSTIGTAILLGLDRELAARFSFLLAIPAISGAALIGLKDFQNTPHSPLLFALLGAIASCLVGYLALRYLIHLVRRGQLHYFAPYCWIVGIVAVVAGR